MIKNNQLLDLLKVQVGKKEELAQSKKLEIIKLNVENNQVNKKSSQIELDIDNKEMSIFRLEGNVQKKEI